MSKFFQILLVCVYILLSSYGVLALLRLWGLRVSPLLMLESCVGWAAYCFSSVYFRPGIFLSRQNVRRPVKAEEDKLNGCFGEVLGQAGISKKFQLLIEEDMACNASAIGLRTIAVCRGSLDKMEPDELKGILAHELGHLQSKDCLFAMALIAASFLPQIIMVIYEKVKLIFIRREIAHVYPLRVRTRIHFQLLLPVIGLLGYWYPQLLVALLATCLFALASRKSYEFVLFLWKVISRYREYRQDAYAYQLGFGTGLRQALIKLTLNEPQFVSLYGILMRGDHPVIYNRIRRLEQLEGIR